MKYTVEEFSKLAGDVDQMLTHKKMLTGIYTPLDWQEKFLQTIDMELESRHISLSSWKGASSYDQFERSCKTDISNLTKLRDVIASLSLEGTTYILESKTTNILNSYESKIAAANTEEELHSVMSSYLGKGGSLSEILKELGTLSPENRKFIGATVNTLKLLIEDCGKERLKQISK